jgi:glutathione S-transferase
MTGEQLSLYELGARDGLRYSQFSWRTRFALAHKGLTFHSVPVRISDKESIAFSGQTKVPILVDGGKVIYDSWSIAEHLEDAFAGRASLFGGNTGRGLARFINAWVDRQLVPSLVPLLMVDVVGLLDAEDAAHLRKGMESAFRASLENVAADREKQIVAFRRLLDPARKTLQAQPFLSGAAPAYADYILCSVFQWARIVSLFEVLEPSDAIAAWRDRVFAHHGDVADARAAASS